MGTCLVTTLKDTASDNSLLKLGEVKIVIKGSYNQNVRDFLFNSHGSGCPITILGKEHFTDSTGVQNLGKTNAGVPANSPYELFISNNNPNEDCVLLVENKNNIVAIQGSAPEIVNVDDTDLLGMDWLVRTTFQIVGDIDYMKYCPKLSEIALYGSECSGDIAVLGEMPQLVKFTAYSQKSIYGNISAISELSNLEVFSVNHTGVTGNLSSLSSLPKLKTLAVKSTAVTGNISSLAGVTTLTGIDVSNTAITGDTSSLANLTNLTTFLYTNTAITGNWPLT